MKKWIEKILIYSFLVMLVLVTVIPFYLITVNATHSSYEIVTRLNLLPGSALVENYKKLQEYVNIWSGFGNSLMVSLVFMIGSGYFGALVAFGFEKYRFKGKKFLYAIVLASMMIPGQVSMIGFDIVNIGLHFFHKDVRPYAAFCSEA